jgi:hypothetical protein
LASTICPLRAVEAGDVVDSHGAGDGEVLAQLACNATAGGKDARQRQGGTQFGERAREELRKLGLAAEAIGPRDLVRVGGEAQGPMTPV